MSQLIACKSSRGIVLAADSKAVSVDDSGTLVDDEIERLIPLSKHTAILTGGAAAGVKMCRSLKDFIAGEGLDDIKAVYQAALPFLASEYEQFMRKICRFHPIDPLHQVNFILAGYSPADPIEPFSLYLLWTRKKLPLLDGEEISTVFTLPRVIRLEYRISQLAGEDAGLDRILSVVQEGLEQQAAAQEEIDRPFSYAILDRDGLRRI
jgi:hypothetical protein